MIKKIMNKINDKFPKLYENKLFSILRKIFYSKCPKCKKHGIFCLKIYNFNGCICECNYCNKEYLVHPIATVIVTMSVFLFLHLLLKRILSGIIGEEIYTIVARLLAIITIYLGEYFAFIEEVEEDKKDS